MLIKRYRLRNMFQSNGMNLFLFVVTGKDIHVTKNLIQKVSVRNYRVVWNREATAPKRLHQRILMKHDLITRT
jgi:hypothetical protein